MPIFVESTHMRRASLLLILLASPLLWAVSVWAEDTATTSTAATSEASERQGLLALLEQQTRIATKTKLNADYVPGMVSVLYGDSLEARGVPTVGEALTLVPGIEVITDQVGRKQLFIRGVAGEFSSGNVKMLLNDVPLNATRDGLASLLFDIPVEQVDRIEVIRGPGSALYGEYAYTGVVNIITYQSGQRLFAATGSFGTRTVGAVLSTSGDTNGPQLSLNAAHWETDGADVQVATDALYHITPPQAGESYAPGRPNAALASDSATMRLSYKGFSLMGQYLVEDSGDHFGTNEALPPDNNREVLGQEIRSLQAQQKASPSDTFDVTLSLSWLENIRDQDQLYLGPASLTGISIAYLDERYKETRGDAGLDLRWTGLPGHVLLIGAALSHVRIADSWWSFTNGPRFEEGLERRIRSITLQDEFLATNRFTLTSGLRYDHYSDVGEAVTPRIAGVWRLTDQHIIKAQYAQAFRPPTFNEVVNSGSGINPATIDTTEIGYIYKGDRTQTKATVFYSKLSDRITLVPKNNSYVYANAKGALLRGIEVEQETRLGTDFKVEASAGYTDAEEQKTGDQIPLSSNWQTNLGLIYEPRADATWTLQYRKVGDFNREAGDPRSVLTGYERLDATVSLTNLGYRGLTLRLGAKNLLNDDIRFPSPLASAPSTLGYANDFPQAGRTWWLRLSYRQ
mgnify:CR=1 FL=1